MFVECSANNAPFNSVKIANSLIDFYKKTRDGCTFEHNEQRNEVHVSLEQDYLYLVKTPFLQSWVAQTMLAALPKKEHLISLALALSELRKRDVILPRFVFSQFSDFKWVVTRPGAGADDLGFTSRDVSRGKVCP